MDTSLAPSTIAGRLAAISDWHRRQLHHLRLAGRPAVTPRKNEGVSALISILERRITRPPRAVSLLRIPDLRAMLRRGFSLSSAFGRHQRLQVHHLPEPGVPMPCRCRRAHLRLPRVRPWRRRALLRAQAVGCRCIRFRVDVDKNVNSMHECFAYHASPTTCLAWLSARSTCSKTASECAARPREAAYSPPPSSPASGPRTSIPPLPRLQISVQGRIRARAFPDPATRTTPLARSVGSHSGRK